MDFKYTPTLDPKSCRFYLAKPGKEIICELNAVRVADFNGEFIKISEISLEVNKYIVDTGITGFNSVGSTLCISNGYDSIDALMEVYVPEIGWFRINEPPETVGNDENNEYKTCILYSYETQLSDKDLKSFYINLGTVDSYEMYEENLNNLGIPKETIQIVNNNNQKLSLLHLALKDTNWTIGHVDTEISLMKRSFEVDSTNLYSFLVNDVSKAVRGIFVFDTYNNTVNLYGVDKIGEDTGVYFTKRNLMNSLNITPYTKDIYTQFEVSGSEELNVAGVNLGSNYIQNIDYFLDKFDGDFEDRYQIYKDKKEILRQEYTEKYKEYVRQLEIKTELVSRLPVDDCDYDWTQYEGEELDVELNAYKNMVTQLEEIYTDNGVFNIEGYSDATLYYSYKDVIIPDIEAEIKYRKENHPSTDERPDKIDYKRMYHLYGVIELNNLLTAAENTRDTLAEAGYDKAYTESDMVSKETFELHHKDWKTAVKDVANITAAIKERQLAVDSCDNKIEATTESRKMIAEKAKIDAIDSNGQNLYNFTDAELLKYSILLRSTDYQDDNIAKTDIDDAISVLELQKELLASGLEELEIESRPQMEFNISSDKIYAMPEFHPVVNKIQLGNFMIVEIGRYNKMRLRLQTIKLDLLDLSRQFDVAFSNMTFSKGMYSDYTNLLESAISSSKNSISKSLGNYIGQNISAMNGKLTASVMKPLLQVMEAQIEKANITNLTAQDLKAVVGKFQYITTEELEAELAKIGHLDVDSAFMNFMKAQISDITYGFIKNLTVDDLLSGTISTNKFIIRSDDGTFSIDGNTMTFYDSTKNARIQIGLDATGNFTFSLYGKDGVGVLLDQDGLHGAAIKDGLIKNPMISNGTIMPEKLGFNVLQADENGNIDISKILMDGHGLDIEFTNIRNEVLSIDAKIEGQNLIRNSNTLIYPDYFFYSYFETENQDKIIDENGNRLLFDP